MLKKLMDIFKTKHEDTGSVIRDRLLVRTKISKDANPLLLTIEEHIKEVLSEKYNSEFKLNSTESKESTPDYEVDAEVEYFDNYSCEKDQGLLGRLFNKNKNSNHIIKNRLDVMIQTKKNDNMLERIKMDINDIISNVAGVEANQVAVERTHSCGGLEIIKMVITLKN